MPDAVLESQVAVVLHGPDDHDSLVAGRQVLARRSAVFVDLVDAARYGTRLLLFVPRLFTERLRNKFLRATAGTAIARLSHRNSVRPSVCPSVRPSVCHTGGSGKNGAS